MTVNIITFDGTASVSPTNYEISKAENPDPTLDRFQRNLGGGYPANVARRLVALDGAVWRWIPMDYKPGFRKRKFGDPTLTYDIPQRTGSIGRALAMLGAVLPTLEGKIVLSGLSQGGWICDLAFEEFRNPAGLFHSRYSDLIAVITFGSPRRPYGHTIPLPGTVNPAGQGVADFPHELSFGTVPGLVSDPPEYMWSFAQMNDAASDNTRNDPARKAQAAMAEFFWDGDISSILGIVPQLRVLLSQIGLTYAWNSDLIQSLWDQYGPGGTSPFAISKWLPFFSGNQGDPTYDPTLVNPHAMYNSVPYDGLITSPIVANTQYVGTWNASTNNPTLSDGTGTSGRLYKVSTAATRNLGSGSTAFAVGDYVIHAGGVWQKAVKNDKSAVDLAVDYLYALGAQYATVPDAPVNAALGYTWWQSPPNPA